MRAPRFVMSYVWSPIVVAATGVLVYYGPPALSNEALGVVFLPAVLIATLLGGMGPGYLTSILSVLLANWFFMTPPRDLFHEDNVLGEFVFLMLSFLLVSMVGIRRQAQQAIRISEKRFRTAQELSLDAFTVLRAVRDRAGTVVDFEWVYANPAAERLLKHGNLAGKRLLQTLSGNYQHKDLFERYVNIVESGGAHDVELQYKADGISGWFRNMAVKLDDGVAVSFSDITLRKTAELALRELNQTLEERVRQRTTELERSYEALRQAERLAAIGQMMTGLSHESRNALQRSLACTSMLQKRVKDETSLRMLVDEVRKAQNDLLRVYENVQDYARPLQPELVHADIAQAWRQAWNKLMAREGRDATLVESCGDVNRECWVDLDQMEQVFRNLMENALAACTDPVLIHVACAPVGNASRPMLEIRFRDNGPGVSAELHSQLFEPFFTTKTKGTGLGLAIVRRIVETHGGRVWNAVGEGGGLEVVIELPLPKGKQLRMTNDELRIGNQD